MHLELRHAVVTYNLEHWNSYEYLTEGPLQNQTFYASYMSQPRQWGEKKSAAAEVAAAADFFNIHISVYSTVLNQILLDRNLDKPHHFLFWYVNGDHYQVLQEKPPQPAVEIIGETIPAARFGSLQDLATQIPNAFVTKDMIPDGNCLFRALSFYLHGTESRHLDICRTLVGHVIDCWDHYSYTITNLYATRICGTPSAAVTQTLYSSYMTRNE